MVRNAAIYGLLPIAMLSASNALRLGPPELHCPSLRNNGDTPESMAASCNAFRSVNAASFMLWGASGECPAQTPTRVWPPAAVLREFIVQPPATMTCINVCAKLGVSGVPIGRTYISTAVPANGRILSAISRCSCALNDRGASLASSLVRAKSASLARAFASSARAFASAISLSVFSLNWSSSCFDSAISTLWSLTTDQVATPANNANNPAMIKNTTIAFSQSWSGKPNITLTTFDRSAPFAIAALLTGFVVLLVNVILRFCQGQVREDRPTELCRCRSQVSLR